MQKIMLMHTFNLIDPDLTNLAGLPLLGVFIASTDSERRIWGPSNMASEKARGDKDLTFSNIRIGEPPSSGIGLDGFEVLPGGSESSIRVMPEWW